MAVSSPELVTPTDTFFDYCHYPYEPLTALAGKWRSRYLLEQSLMQSGCQEPFQGLVDALRANFGVNATVWGVKNIGDLMQCELYFYNYGRQDPRMTPADVLETLRPYFELDISGLPEDLRYFMFSVDVLPQHFASGKLDGLHIYVHDVQDRATALSYHFDGARTRLENHYAFYRPLAEWSALCIKAIDSAFVDPARTPIDQILIPELADCYSICIANKQDCDGIYFSRIDITQLLFFLKRFAYPPELVASVEQNLSRLDYLRYDVGFDYYSRGGELVIRKSGFYGTI
jgi:hypothetical protein